MNIAACIPVFRPGPEFFLLADSLPAQTCPLGRILLVDSSPAPVAALNQLPPPFAVERFTGFFDHGKTRRMASELLSDAEIILFLTQDALPADVNSIRYLVDCFQDETVGAAFGRQLPRPTAAPIEAHARLFNYPDESRVKSAADIPAMGVKATFMSNSFAAYRRAALEAVGGFPERCIVSEDTHVAARMLLGGWKIAYCAEATVYHSHDYSWRQEFQRYFDIGVFHAREAWVRKSFGAIEGEGGRFVRSELRYLAKVAPRLLPSALLRTLIKYVGFRVGLAEQRVPAPIKRRFSMQKAFWNGQ